MYRADHTSRKEENNVGHGYNSTDSTLYDCLVGLHKMDTAERTGVVGEEVRVRTFMLRQVET